MPGTSGARAGPGADGPDSRNGEWSGSAAGAEQPEWPYRDHPSWPPDSTGRPLTPDHPSWPAGGLPRPIGDSHTGGTAPDLPYGDHLSWPADGLGRPVAGAGYPRRPVADPGGRPADDGPGEPRRELPGEPPPPPGMHHSQYPRPPAPHVPPARGRHARIPGGYSGYPRPGVPTGDTSQRWPAQPARTTGPIPQTYDDLAVGDGGPQVMLTKTPGGDPSRAAGPGARSGQVLHLPGPGMAGGPVPWDTGEYGDTGPVRVAERVLADADQQAAAIRQKAASHAVAIREAAEREAAETRQQAAGEAAPIREAAVRAAAEIRDQAAAQVAAIREAADREIAERRATVLAVSDELRRVAEYVTECLASPGQPVVPPPRRAGPRPLVTPVQAQPDAEPSAEPAGHPPGKRGAGPAGKPGASAKGRQVRAMHKVVAAFVAVSVAAFVAGAAEVALHGFPFFVFRANGAGASLTGLKEDQGPGQPDAPGAHRKAPAVTEGAAAQAHHPGAKSQGKKSHGKPENKQPHGKQRHGKHPPGRQGPKPG